VGADAVPVLACIRKESVGVERIGVPGGEPGTITAASFLGVAEEYIVNVCGVAIRATRPAAGFLRGDIAAGWGPDNVLIAALSP